MKLRRHTQPDPNQLALQLDFFEPNVAAGAHEHLPVPPRQESSHAPGLTTVMTAPPTRSTNGTRRLHLGEHVIDYILLRSKRRSIGFLINDDGLRVTAPQWVTLGEIENAIREKKRWIFTKLNERRERSARRLQPQMQWRDGAAFPYLGQDITLHIRATLTEGITYDEQTQKLTICLPDNATEQQLKDRVLSWLQTQAKELFAARLPIYAEKLGVTYQSFALSSATTQWGSCTIDGKIRLNWRLMHFALPLVDYVIAHELSHLREMNHSPRFWATVQSVFPEFDTARKALRESTPEMLPIF